ncbi:MAG: metal-sulfur cluster assembly factor [Planctomycetota bacterium]
MRQIDHSIPGRDDVPTMKKVIEALHGILDPELGLDIVELGLVYEVTVLDKDVEIKMTLTSMGCPVGPAMVSGAQRAVEMGVPGVRSCTVSLVWEPPWSHELLSPSARAAMGW